MCTCESKSDPANERVVYNNNNNNNNNNFIETRLQGTIGK